MMLPDDVSNFPGKCGLPPRPSKFTGISTVEGGRVKRSDFSKDIATSKEWIGVNRTRRQLAGAEENRGRGWFATICKQDFNQFGYFQQHMLRVHKVHPHECRARERKIPSEEIRNPMQGQGVEVISCHPQKQSL